MVKRKERPIEMIKMVMSIYSETNSAYKTADKVGLTPYIVYSILKENDVHVPSWKEEKPLRWKVKGEDAKNLIQDYINGDKHDILIKKYNVSRDTIKKTLRREGVKLRDHGGQRRRVSDKEAEEIVSLYKLGLPQVAIATKMKCASTVVSRVLLSNGFADKHKAAGENHGSWKGGMSKSAEGYILQKIYKIDPYFSMARRSGYVPQHRYVMAQHLGRVLRANETVHHVNGDRTDNRIENLQIRYGRHGNGVKLQCACCGSYDIKTINL